MKPWILNYAWAFIYVCRWKYLDLSLLREIYGNKKSWRMLNELHWCVYIDQSRGLMMLSWLPEKYVDNIGVWKLCFFTFILFVLFYKLCGINQSLMDSMVFNWSITLSAFNFWIHVILGAVMPQKKKVLIPMQSLSFISSVHRSPLFPQQ